MLDQIEVTRELTREEARKALLLEIDLLVKTYNAMLLDPDPLRRKVRVMTDIWKDPRTRQGTLSTVYTDELGREEAFIGPIPLIFAESTDKDWSDHRKLRKPASRKAKA